MRFPLPSPQDMASAREEAAAAGQKAAASSAQRMAAKEAQIAEAQASKAAQAAMDAAARAADEIRAKEDMFRMARGGEKHLRPHQSLRRSWLVGAEMSLRELTLVCRALPP